MVAMSMRADGVIRPCPAVVAALRSVIGGDMLGRRNGRLGRAGDGVDNRRGDEHGDHESQRRDQPLKACDRPVHTRHVVSVGSFGNAL